MKQVLVILTFILLLPLFSHATGLEADAMCNPVFVQCPCGTVPSKKGCVGGANMHQCPCFDVTSGRTTKGICIAPNKCQGQSSEGLGGGAEALKAIGDIMKQVMDMLKQGGGGGGGGEQSGAGSGNLTNCTQYKPVSVPTSNPCEYYVPPVSSGLLSGTSSASNALLQALGGGVSDQLLQTTTTTGTVATIRISANPTQVAIGQATSLQWSTSNAVSCTASGGWSGSQGLQGIKLVENITAGQAFTLTCVGANGSSVSNTVSVSVFTPSSSDNQTNNPSVVTTQGSSIVTNTNLTQSARLSNEVTGSVITKESGASVVARNRDSSTNTEVAGFFGTTNASISSAPTIAGRLCQARPWSGLISYVIPTSFFDSLCTRYGYSTAKPVIVPQTQPRTPVRTNAPRATTTKTVMPKTATSTATSTVAQPTGPAGFADIWAVPASVPVGSRTSIFWNSRNVSSCSVTSPDGSFSEKAVTGGASTVPLSGATTFSISCIGLDGKPATDFVTVKMKL